jgi:hypothetical protein
MVFISRVRRLRLLQLIKSHINRHNQILQFSEAQDGLIPYYWFMKLTPFLYCISYFMEGPAMSLAVQTVVLGLHLMNSTTSNASTTTVFRYVFVPEKPLSASQHSL